ncbi:MAG: hypothetical protein SynsKO_03300 [Synoicihabitans sp.]
MFSRSRILLAVALCSPVWAQSPPSSEELPSYLFLSGKVKVNIKKDRLPIRNFDGEYFHFAESQKSLSADASVRAWLQPVMVLSNYYADISGLSYRLGSERNDEDKNRPLRPAQDQPLFQETELDARTKAHIENALREFKGSRWIDTLDGRCEITSTRSVENAYAALVLSIDQVIPRVSQAIRRTAVNLVPVGNLAAGESRTLEFNTQFPLFEALSADLEIFLFDGSGKHIATNLSRGLEELTPEQVDELRALEMKNRSNPPTATKTVLPPQTTKPRLNPPSPQRPGR